MSSSNSCHHGVISIQKSWWRRCTLAGIRPALLPSQVWMILPVAKKRRYQLIKAMSRGKSIMPSISASRMIAKRWPLADCLYNVFEQVQKGDNGNMDCRCSPSELPMCIMPRWNLCSYTVLSSFCTDSSHFATALLLFGFGRNTISKERTLRRQICFLRF